jgi:hypothetical protein
MTTEAHEVLAVWREVERILEAYEAREQRDLRTESLLRAEIVELRSLFQAITNRSIDTQATLATSQETIAAARRLLGTLREKRASTDGARQA